MQSENITLYRLHFGELKTYLLSAAFVAGNILLPQLCHLIPQGGLMLLPIYFFTLIGAYKYGWRVGLLTAIASPLLNHLMFTMPPAALLPAILTKSILLALVAGYFARTAMGNKELLRSITLAVATYQIAGTLIEWAIVGDLYVALQDLRIGIPGILIQIFGGYLFVNYLVRR